MADLSYVLKGSALIDWADLGLWDLIEGDIEVAIRNILGPPPVSHLIEDEMTGETWPRWPGLQYDFPFDLDAAIAAFPNDENDLCLLHDYLVRKNTLLEGRVQARLKIEEAGRLLREYIERTF